MVGTRGGVIESIDFLLDNGLVTQSHDIHSLRSFKADIYELNRAPIDETIEEAEPSQTLDEITSRLSRIDPSFSQENAQVYLAAEEDVCNAVYNISRAGFNNPELIKRALEEGARFTDQYVTFAEFYFLTQNNDTKWTPSNIPELISRLPPQIQVASRYMTQETNILNEVFGVFSDAYPGTPSKVPDKTLDNYMANIRIINEFLFHRVLATDGEDSRENHDYVKKKIIQTFGQKYRTGDFEESSAYKRMDGNGILATELEIKQYSTELSKLGYISERCKERLDKRAENFTEATKAYLAEVDKRFTSAKEFKHHFHKVLNRYETHSKRILFIEGLTNHLERSSDLDSSDINIYGRFVSEMQRKFDTLNSLKQFRRG